MKWYEVQFYAHGERLPFAWRVKVSGGQKAAAAAGLGKLEQALTVKAVELPPDLVVETECDAIECEQHRKKHDGAELVKQRRMQP